MMMMMMMMVVVVVVVVVVEEQSVECELKGKRKYTEKTCPSATLSTRSPYSIATLPLLQAGLLVLR
jgi:hypothetical protein